MVVQSRKSSYEGSILRRVQIEDPRNSRKLTINIEITSADSLLAQCLQLSSQLNITNNGEHGIHNILRSDAALDTRVTGFIKGRLTSELNESSQAERTSRLPPFFRVRAANSHSDNDVER